LSMLNSEFFFLCFIVVLECREESKKRER
jgi:hypothetical protein